DPRELLDRVRFPDRAAVEDRLLAGFVAAVYHHPPAPAADDQREAHRRPALRWDVKRARHWLTGIAAHLDAAVTPDLAWWRASRAVPVQVLRTVAAAGSALGYGLILVVALWADAGAGSALRWGWPLVVAGALGGYALAALPPTPPGRLRSRP